LASENYLNLGYYYPIMDNIIQKCLKNKDVIAFLLKFPEREVSIRTISKETKQPYASMWRFIKLLAGFGIVYLKKFGAYNVCKLNKESPYLKELKKALNIEQSPHRSAYNEFIEQVKQLKDIRKIYLFGSVASGKERPESDIDVAIIVSKKSAQIESKINEAVDKVLEHSRLQIVVHILTQKELEENVSFKEELEKGELTYG
jgi:predicted nucleotidyltransferase